MDFSLFAHLRGSLDLFSYSLFLNDLIFDILFVATFQILLGFASFFVVSIGGTLLGLLWGLTTAFVTKYTDHVRGVYITV